MLIAYGADKFLSKELKQTHTLPDEYSIWNDIYNGKVNSEIVIYGSSQGMDTNKFGNDQRQVAHIHL